MSVITSGSGTQAGVTSVHRQMVEAAIRGNELCEIENGWGFTVIEDTVTPTGAGDCFLYLGNNSSDPCVLSRFSAEFAGAEDIYFLLSDTYALGTTHALVDAAFNRIGGAHLLATKMTAEAGVDITGIPGTTYEVKRVETGAGTHYDDLFAVDEMIVIPPGKALSIFAGTGTAAITHIAADLHFVMEPDSDL